MTEDESHYSVLGISEGATTEEIKAAFRKKAFDHHPDANKDASAADRDQFQRVLRAYEVLRDDSKRSSYDFLRRTKPSSFGTAASSSYSSYYSETWPHHRSSNNDADWERAFDEWAKRMQDEFGGYGAEAEEIQREKNAAERIARAAAWERAKRDAALNKLRSERIRQRAEDARHTRHAAVLRRFWQSRSGVTWQDLVVGVLFLACTTGAAVQMKQHIRRHAELLEQETTEVVVVENAVVSAISTQPP